MAKQIRVNVEVRDKGSKVVKKFTTTTDKSFKKLKKSTTNVNAGFTKTISKLKLMTAAAVAFGAAAAISFGKKAVDAASDLQEVVGKFETVFRDQITVANEFSQVLVDSYGLSERAAKQYLSSVQDLLKPMGMQSDAAADMSNAVVKLAVDLGSFNNLKTEKVIDDMNSALVGNFETMKKYGVILNEAVVQNEAYAMGIANVGDKLNANQKAIAAYSLIVKGSADAVGDWARTSGNFANQMKQLESNIEKFSAAVGKEVLPKLTKMVKQFNEWAIINGKLNPALRTLIDSLDEIAIAVAALLGLGIMKWLYGMAAGLLGLASGALASATAFGAMVKAEKAAIAAFAPAGAAIGAFEIAMANLGLTIDSIGLISILGPVGLIAAMAALYLVFKDITPIEEYIEELGLCKEAFFDVAEAAEKATKAAKNFNYNKLLADIAKYENIVRRGPQGAGPYDTQEAADYMYNLAVKELANLKKVIELYDAKQLDEGLMEGGPGSGVMGKNIFKAADEKRKQIEKFTNQILEIKAKYYNDEAAQALIWYRAEQEKYKGNKEALILIENEYQRRLGAIGEDERKAAIEKQKQILADIREAQASILFTPQSEGQMSALEDFYTTDTNVSDFVEDNKKAADEINQMWTDVANQGINEFASGFADIVTGAQTAKEAFANMAQSMSRYLIELATQMMMVAAIKSALGMTGGSLFSFADGGITPEIPGAASGAVFNGPSSGYPVMMHGNEAVIPLKNGKVPVEMGGGTGGEITNNININVTPNKGTAEEARQYGNEIGRAVKAEVNKIILDNKRSGGILNRQQSGVY